MLTLGEIAARDGVSSPSVCVRVKRFVERHGLSVERDAHGRVSRVNVAEYDALRAKFGASSKAVKSAAQPLLGRFCGRARRHL